MNEVAPIPVDTEMVVFEASAFFCFVLGIVLVVFAELTKPMSKLASFFIGTVSIFHVLLA